MDFTKFFEPVRGIIGYLISRTGTIIVTAILLFVNFDFGKKISEMSIYIDKYHNTVINVIPFVPPENQGLVLTILVLFGIIGLLETHSAILNFLNRLSPFTFVSYAPNFEPFENDIDLIWKCYSEKLDLGELEKLHQIRKSMEEPKRYPAPTGIFDYISGWIFLMLILYFYLEIKSASTFIESIFILLIAGWVWAYRRAQYGSYGWEESRKAAFWLYEHRLHDPQKLTDEQQERLGEYHDSRRNLQRFREPGASISISWLDFLYRLLIPSSLRAKIGQYRWKREKEFREALGSLFGDGRSTKRL